MPSFADMKRMYGQSNNIGQQIKQMSDDVMEWTWDNDLQSKIAYVYDYTHDDKSNMNRGMTYEYTTKTRIDVKFSVKKYQAMDQDQVEFYIQFKPSQKVEFQPGDDFYYYETDYVQKYANTFPIGLYCDIPDEKGVYEKWIICGIETNNQFTKYLVLPCNYPFHWIEYVNGKRVIRKMWGVTRSQNSYNSGFFWFTLNLSNCWDILKIYGYNVSMK